MILYPIKIVNNARTKISRVVRIPYSNLLIVEYSYIVQVHVRASITTKKKRILVGVHVCKVSRV